MTKNIKNKNIKISLVIMAAGFGKRFGNGIKQLTKIGVNGETIIDYSIYNALKIGFNKIVFIIRKDIESEFRKIIGNKIEKIVEVQYVFQELLSLYNFKYLNKHFKPWGTGCAILSAKNVLSEPFAVINADDYYGEEAYIKIYNYLIKQYNKHKLNICMICFLLKNTLSNNGPVSRGICSVNKNKKLIKIKEMYNIKKISNKKIIGYYYNNKYILKQDELVSMNMWGLNPKIFKYIENEFVIFLKKYNSEKCINEFLLPKIINELIKKNKINVTVFKTNSIWYGITYKKDKENIIKNFNKKNI